jgi:hypothetical protein
MIEDRVLGRYREIVGADGRGEAPGAVRVEEEPPLTESTRDILGP